MILFILFIVSVKVILHMKMVTLGDFLIGITSILIAKKGYCEENKFSVSNSRDYQAKRNNTKYRDTNGTLNYVCTLNGSGLATSRLVPAIVEQYQNKDGSFTVPEVLRYYMDNIEKNFIK